MSDTEQEPKGKRRDGAIALALVGLVAAMTGLAFASVPLYRMFCQATGYGGVPQRAERAPRPDSRSHHPHPLRRQCRSGAALDLRPGANA